MGRVRRERNQDEKKDGGIGGSKLGRGQNNDDLEKVETRRNRRAASVKNKVGDITRDERARGGYERNQDAKIFEAHIAEIEVVDLLHESKKPLIDPLSDRARAGVSERDDPDDGIRRDRFEDF